MKVWHKIALGASIGLVGGIIGMTVYRSVRKKGTVLDGNQQLDADMQELIKRIEKAPK